MNNDSKTSLFIIKIGGNVLDEPAARAAFVRDFAALPGPKLLVHGGGKIATQLGQRLGIEAKYVAGRRVTDAATLELVTMVYGGLVNRRLVAELAAAGCPAIGLTGADADILPAARRAATAEIDFGHVGDPLPEQVGVAALRVFFEKNWAPVFAPLTHDGMGNLLNTNADTIASVVARALAGFYNVRLIFCFEKKGVLENPDDENSARLQLTRADYRILREKTAVSGGILPKLDNAFAAAENGVASVLIGHAAELLENAMGKNPSATRILP